MTDRIEHHLDREAIRDVVLRYCRGVDRDDAELLASAYHDDAVDEHGSAVFRGDAIATGILQLVNASRTSLHQITNILITNQSSDQAACESYFTAWQSVDQDHESRMLVAIGRYVDQFEKRLGQWRVAHRTVIVEHVQMLPAEGVLAVKHGTKSHRNRDDPSYVVLGMP